MSGITSVRAIRALQWPAQQYHLFVTFLIMYRHQSSFFHVVLQCTVEQAQSCPITFNLLCRQESTLLLLCTLPFGWQLTDGLPLWQTVTCVTLWCSHGEMCHYNTYMCNMHHVSMHIIVRLYYYILSKTKRTHCFMHYIIYRRICDSTRKWEKI